MSGLDRESMGLIMDILTGKRLPSNFTAVESEPLDCGHPYSTAIMNDRLDEWTKKIRPLYPRFFKMCNACMRKAREDADL